MKILAEVLAALVLSFAIAFSVFGICMAIAKKRSLKEMDRYNKRRKNSDEDMNDFDYSPDL